MAELDIVDDDEDDDPTRLDHSWRQWRDCLDLDSWNFQQSRSSSTALLHKCGHV